VHWRHILVTFRKRMLRQNKVRQSLIINKFNINSNGFNDLIYAKKPIATRLERTDPCSEYNLSHYPYFINASDVKLVVKEVRVRVTFTKSIFIRFYFGDNCFRIELEKHFSVSHLVIVNKSKHHA
jgi:hypothetical protein